MIIQYLVFTFFYIITPDEYACLFKKIVLWIMNQILLFLYHYTMANKHAFHLILSHYRSLSNPATRGVPQACYLPYSRCHTERPQKLWLPYSSQEYNKIWNFFAVISATLIIFIHIFTIPHDTDKITVYRA